MEELTMLQIINFEVKELIETRNDDLKDSIKQLVEIYNKYNENKKVKLMYNGIKDDKIQWKIVNI